MEVRRLDKIYWPLGKNTEGCDRVFCYNTPWGRDLRIHRLLQSWERAVRISSKRNDNAKGIFLGWPARILAGLFSFEAETRFLAPTQIQKPGFLTKFLPISQNLRRNPVSNPLPRVRNRVSWPNFCQLTQISAETRFLAPYPDSETGFLIAFDFGKQETGFLWTLLVDGKGCLNKL
jgi:hypothetical protein